MSSSQIAQHALRRTPLAVLRRVVPPATGILGVNYHVVSDQRLSHVENVLSYKSSALFEQDLSRLQERFDIVGYDDVVSAAASRRVGGSFEDRARGGSVMLTFDDGYSECFSVVRPILVERGLPCTFFVIADAVDNRFLAYPNKISLCIDAFGSLPADEAAEGLARIEHRLDVRLPAVDGFAPWLMSMHYADTGLIDEVGASLGLDWDAFLRDQQPFMTSDQIKQLVGDGFTIGAHSLRHPYLRTLDDPDDIEREIVESCRFVQEVTGQERVPFAFPFSADGLDRQFLQDILLRHGFIGLLFNTRELALDREFIVNRIPGDGGPDPYLTSQLMETITEAYRREAIRRIRLHSVTGAVKRVLRR